MKNIIDYAYPICLGIPRQKKHVSLILHKNQIVSVGMNKFKTHPKAHKIGYRFGEMHSELDAFQKIQKKYRGKKLQLINVRFNRFGQMRMARPCVLCMPWCLEIFDEIYYTTDDGIVKLED